jgi:hypothetical protein
MKRLTDHPLYIAALGLAVVLNLASIVLILLEK